MNSFFIHTHTRIFEATLFMTAKNWKPPKRPSIEGWILINKLWCVHIMEFYPAAPTVKMNEIMVHETIWINLMDIMWNEKGQLCCIILFTMWTLRTGKIINDDLSQNIIYFWKLGIDQAEAKIELWFVSCSKSWLHLYICIYINTSFSF